MEFTALPRWLVRLAVVVVLTSIYVAAAKLGLLLAVLPGGVTAVWPPAGLGVAAVLRLGYGIWPALFLGAFIEEILYRGSAIDTIAISSSIAAGNTLEALLSAFLMYRFIGRHNLLEQARDVFKFVALAGLVSPIASTTIGVTTLCLAGSTPWSDYTKAWWTWWIADAVSILVFAPLLVIWSKPFKRAKFTQREISPFSWVVEAALLLALVLAFGYVAFGDGYPVEYMLIPFLVWAAFRFGQRGATLLIFIVSEIAILGTVNGFGPFVRQSLNQSLLLLESFIGVIAVTTLVLAALLEERRQAEASLQKANEELEYRVEQRTASLMAANQALQLSQTQLKEQATQLKQTLAELRQTQTQLIHTEKMSSLGQLVAGVAHEINNPVSFIYGNVEPASEYIQDLLRLLALYQQHYPQPVPEIQAEAEAIDLNFLLEDLSKLLSSMKMGADRIRQIVLSLRNFSRLDEAEMKPVDIHEGIDNTLLILHHRLKETAENHSIQIIKEYGKLPLVECYAGQLNQVFMNLLTNAIDALEELKVEGCKIPSSNEASDVQPVAPTILIRTWTIDSTRVGIGIADNGIGMNEEVKKRLFDPFFTTKPVGKGTGLGLAISYQLVVEKHGGQLKCHSTLGQGTEFIIEVPTKHS